MMLLKKKRLTSQANQAGETEQYMVQDISRRYCLAAMALFAVQSMVALLGALDLVVPDLPSPVPFEYGRAIHLNFATLWPLIGTMGMVYFFTAAELKRDIFSPQIARWQFWIILAFTLAILGSQALRISNGREFLEGLPVFYLGIGLALGLKSYNLVRTLWQSKKRLTPASAVMTLGVIFLFLLLLPNAIHYANPVADEMARFWLVHLWEELAFELTSAGFIASFYIVSGLAGRPQIEKWLYLEAGLTLLGGFFGTGHHYYWIGFPAFWLVVGPLFSLVELIPVGMLVHMTYKGLKSARIKNRREKLTLWLLLSSLFHHVVGASLLGILITIPRVNLYMHGTYITSGHAHLALFGALGFLVIAGCFYILSQGSEPTVKTYRWGIVAVLLLNGGLLLMSSMLLAAGFLQTYFWRMYGMDFMQVQVLINPYLILRVPGGAMFALGDVLLFWCIVKAWWKTRKNKKA